ncbi:hypothetical protein [Streptacidiphilus anmyonensis]|uniref:hypothetical protein n=1 Tax=Streptacidiphilus anmyonensis TaxID=405782 RepID=UPI0005A95B3E|nr:hypothetical protein [Streptacidiphilus anmyonensis]
MPDQTHLVLTGFDPAKPEHVQQITDLFTLYLAEDFERTRFAPMGHPVGFHLRTLTVWDGPAMVAFCSIDTARYSIELIYVTPTHRRQGIAETVYRDLKSSCPRELHVKGPLSPAGLALAERVGLPVDHGTEDEIAESAKVDAEFHSTLRAVCGHSRGNPLHACSRCYQRAFRRVARAIVGNYAEACQLIAEGKAVLI